MNFSEFDRKCMSRAISLAKRGMGKTSPNPLVGALVVKNNSIIGEGWHKQYGGRHAEKEALYAALAAGKSPVGADLYCTLEPCCFTAPDKNQPPCTKLIINSGIRRVFIANIDPNPKVKGRGIRALEKAGLKVRAGLLASAAEKLNEAYFTYHRLGRPFVSLKIAQSIDGRIAASGESSQITDDAARRLVHRMRSCHDAVLIGRGTALADNPQLTVRQLKGNNPLRVVLDSKLSLPVSLRLFSLPDPEKTIVICSDKAAPDKIAALQNKGIRIITLPHDHCSLPLTPCPLFSLQTVLSALAELGIRSVLVEGGGAVFTSFLREGLWDRLSVFIAPIVIGEGVSAVGDLRITAVSNALRLCNVSIKRIGDQVLIEGNREDGNVYRDC